MWLTKHHQPSNQVAVQVHREGTYTLDRIQAPDPIFMRYSTTSLQFIYFCIYTSTWVCTGVRGRLTVLHRCPLVIPNRRWLSVGVLSWESVYIYIYICVHRSVLGRHACCLELFFVSYRPLLLQRGGSSAHLNHGRLAAFWSNQNNSTPNFENFPAKHVKF
jgi:hypothetical protein